jgi:transposase
MRYELTDCEWFAIKPLLPNKSRGIPRVNDRRVLNGIFWILRPAHLGAICPEASDCTPLAIIASFAGAGLVSGAVS